VCRGDGILPGALLYDEQFQPAGGLHQTEKGNPSRMASEGRPEGANVMAPDPEESPGESPQEPSEEGRAVSVSEAYPEVTSEASPDDAPPEDDDFGQDTAGQAARPEVYEYYGPEVQRELRNEPWNFEFFQAVRLLERYGTGKPVGRFVENP